MSLLKTGVYANATTPLFALPGSGGGSTSTLQSPASVTPEVNGDSSLSLTAQGGGNATLSVSSPFISSLPIYGETESRITLGNLGSTIFLNTFNDGVLSIRQGANTTPALASFDVVGNVVNLGNSGTPSSVLVNAPLTLSAPSKATFTAQTVSPTGGTWVAGDNSIALGGFGRGMYVIYGDTGGATTPIDLNCRPNSIFVIDPANTVSGGGGGADTNWNMSPNGTGGLTLTLTDAPSSAFSMKVMPLYVF